MPFIMFFSVCIKAILLFFYLQSSEVHGEDCTCEYSKQAFMVLVREWDGMRGYSSESCILICVLNAERRTARPNVEYSHL